jgi:arylsulfatase A-like enzyme
MVWPIYGQASRYSEPELEDLRRLYRAEVALTDTWLGYFLDRMERLGRFEDTLVLLTTDHGHLFGEHGMVGKPSTGHGDSNMYQPLAHVPLIAAHPDAAPGRRVEALVQPVDLYPTILGALGLAAPREVHGRDLAPLLRGERADDWRRHAFYAKFGEAINATDGRYTLFQWPPGEANGPLHWYSAHPPEFLKPRGIGPYEPARTRFPIDWARGPMRTALYDLAADPGQERDLAADQPATLRRLQGALRDWLRALEAPPEQLERLGLEG